MPNMVPRHTVVVSRPHPSGKKDKEGNPIHERIQPPLGQPFDFTQEEIDDINRMHPTALRDPINEGGEEQELPEDKAEREAVDAARPHRAAPADAARVARTAAVGKGGRKQPDNTDRGEAPGSDAVKAGEGEEDEL